MLVGFPQLRNAGEDAVRGVLTAFVAQAVEFPAWAVARACKAIAGRASPFPPSAGEFHAAVASEVQPHADDLRKIGRILSAEPAPEKRPADRDAMRAKIAALREELGGPREADKRELTRDEAEAWLEREASKAKEPIKISDALRDTFNRQALERAANG